MTASLRSRLPSCRSSTTTPLRRRRLLSPAAASGATPTTRRRRRRCRATAKRRRRRRPRRRGSTATARRAGSSRSFPGHTCRPEEGSIHGCSVLLLLVLFLHGGVSRLLLLLIEHVQVCFERVHRLVRDWGILLESRWNYVVSCKVSVFETVLTV